jgi:hypothetical protein
MGATLSSGGGRSRGAGAVAGSAAAPALAAAAGMVGVPVVIRCRPPAAWRRRVWCSRPEARRRSAMVGVVGRAERGRGNGAACAATCMRRENSKHGERFAGRDDGRGVPCVCVRRTRRTGLCAVRGAGEWRGVSHSPARAENNCVWGGWGGGESGVPNCSLSFLILPLSGRALLLHAPWSLAPSRHSGRTCLICLQRGWWRRPARQEEETTGRAAPARPQLRPRLDPSSCAACLRTPRSPPASPPSPTSTWRRSKPRPWQPPRTFSRGPTRQRLRTRTKPRPQGPPRPTRPPRARLCSRAPPSTASYARPAETCRARPTDWWRRPGGGRGDWAAPAAPAGRARCASPRPGRTTCR